MASSEEGGILTPEGSGSETGEELKNVPYQPPQVPFDPYPPVKVSSNILGN